jgi:hypothetical protein
MLRFSTVILLALLMSACGGGGSSNNDTSSRILNPGKTFKLGGVVTGVVGNLVIANGEDTVTLSAEGSFVFAKPVNEGQLYDVKIIALPSNQLCELRNAKNYAYRDHFDVVVECANLVERNVNLVLPANLNLSQLRLLSNYQAKGGDGEEPLALSNRLKVFDNSVVSLRTIDNKTLFLAALGQLSSGDIELGSKSTAIALMLLEPAVVSAMHDRGLVSSQILADLLIAVNANGDLDALTAEIENLINNNGSLTSPTKALNAALSRVLYLAINFISRSYVLPSVALNTVNFSYVKNTSSSVTVSATNASARYVNLFSDTDQFSSLTLLPFNSLDIMAVLAPQEKLTVNIAGPGELGVVSDANAQRVINATIDSGVRHYFLPSLNVLLGLKNAASFDSEDCLTTETINSLGAKSQTKNTIRNAVLADQYYLLFTDLSADARSQPFITELFNCEKFGVGVFLASKKALAIDNTTAVLKTLNAIYNPLNMPADLNLFSMSGVSFLAEAIAQGYAENRWILSPEEKVSGQWRIQKGEVETSYQVVRSVNLYDADADNLQIRLFATENQDDPQLSLLLPNFDFTNDGLYVLDDLPSGQTCLGFFADDALPASNLYCTSTAQAENAMTGSVTVTTDMATQKKIASFDFEAVDVKCINLVAACEKIRVIGQLTFDENF